jgi:hypothetical protein
VSKLSLTLIALLLACAPGTPPSGHCASSSDCPSGDVCLFQNCTSASTINANLSAVVWPTDPSLAPQQYLPFELNPSGVPLTSVAIVLHQPQHLLGQFVLPPSCEADVDAGTAFPVEMQFVGTSIIPGQPWNFLYKSDAMGMVDAVLPVFESFQRTISPAISCAPPVLGTQRVLQSGPYDVGKLITFPGASESLRVIGALTSSGGGSGYPDAGGPSGALVTILPADPTSGQALSISVPATGPEATFDLQIPYAQAAPTPLAMLTLSVQPWTGGLRNYPTILMPFTGLIVDAGEPTLHLVGVDGGPLVLQLPYDGGTVIIAGYTQSPADGGTPLPDTAVEVSSLSLANCVLDAGSCTYQQTTVSNDQAVWSLDAPPGTYSISVIPQYPASNQLIPTTTERACLTTECSNTSVAWQANQGIEVSGWVVRHNQEPFDDEGQAAIYSLPGMSLLSFTRLAPDGGFTLYGPAGRQMLIITPDEVTGYPSTYETVDVISASDQSHEIILPAPGLLTGTVSVEPLDGGTLLPVSNASVLFYYVTSDPDGGEIAIPYTNGVTDALGNFSVVAMPVPRPNQ